MRRRLAYVLVPLALIGLSAGLVSGCKQKAGERCQVDDDCDTDLVCNTGTGVCQPKNSVTLDTNIMPDDNVPLPDAPVDATPADASVDGMPDAT